MRFLYILFILFPFFISAQFTHDDTLKGSITKERAWWDVLHYNLSVEVIPQSKSLIGCNEIDYIVVKENQGVMQIDLQSPLHIDSVYSIVEGRKIALDFRKIAKNVYYVFTAESKIGALHTVLIYYSGTPIEAIKPPWQGGVVWSKDTLGNDFIATACQGIGASAWWPCKDHGYDEPDSGALISITTPSHLMNVSNGQLIENKTIKNNKRITTWEVKNPINNYGINFNIGNYTSWDSIYSGEKGPLKMSFYVLKQDLEKAKIQFQDAYRMMEAFEYWFGPYPFYEDGYKLVQVPYLGMEHQSSVTYGNHFENGYLGTDLSGTGWGLKWDFIIIHESGHEWFANNITCKDKADMWIHESFTSYSESLFTEYYYGKDAGYAYVRGLRKKVVNDRPIIAAYGVDQEGSYDMYYKGANMLHTIRQIVNDDDKWLQLLRNLNKTFYHKTVESKEIEEYMSTFLGIDLTNVFTQYLRTNKVPKLHLIQKRNSTKYRWENCIDSFNMPIDVYIDNQKKRLYPTTKNQKIKAIDLVIDENYYVR